MNWIRENKFLTGFIAVLVIGAGVLGYLLYTAYGDYSEVTDQYSQSAADLHQLQTRVPYPNQANLTKYRAQLDTLKEATNGLAASLKSMEIPIEDLSPSAFQDRLRDTVSAVISKAGQSGVKLPEKFYMDFDQYQTLPPAGAAAGPLGRQLAGLQLAMNYFLDDRVDSIASFKRYGLPQEPGGATHAGHTPGQGQGGFGGFGGQHNGPGSENGGNSGNSGLVDTVSFDVSFISSQPAFQRVLNDFAASSKQFFITRSLAVANSDPKPVSKVEAAAPGASPAPSQAAASGTDANRLHFLVGTEKIAVSMHIDMVNFNLPDKGARKP